MKFKLFLKSLGPGLLWAGAAIGVSHLVQSTRAGAIYGFELVWLILFFNLIKYPFFEFAPRYASATGESLLAGYKRLGKWVVWLYLGLTLATMFTIQAAVTIVTAGIFGFVFGGVLDIFIWSLIILAFSTILIVIGKYKVLDSAIKIIILILTISAIIAVVFAINKGFNPNPEFVKNFEWKKYDILLLIAFAGWMPSAIDISVWHSFWILAKNKGKKINIKASLMDFNIGYIGTAFLAIIFLSLGAMVMYGTGNEFSSKGVVFAGQLINLFTSNIGAWAFILIAIAAITTMSSTTLTCLDAYPRVLKPTTEILFPKLKKNKTNIVWFVWLIILLIGTIIIIKFFMSKMTLLVDLATSLSFITAPILGYMNYRVVNGKNVPKKYRPKLWLKILSWFGIIVLSLFSIYYIYFKIFVTN